MKSNILRMFSKCCAKKNLGKTLPNYAYTNPIDNTLIWFRACSIDLAVLAKTGYEQRHDSCLRTSLPSELIAYVAGNRPLIGWGGCIEIDKVIEFLESNTSKGPKRNIIIAIPNSEMLSVSLAAMTGMFDDDFAQAKASSEGEHIVSKVSPIEIIAAISACEMNAFKDGIMVENLLSNFNTNLPKRITIKDSSSHKDILTWFAKDGKEEYINDLIKNGVLKINNGNLCSPAS